MRPCDERRLVEHHLLLAVVSQRRDLGDPAVIRKVADQVVNAGAGVRVKFTRVRAEALREVIHHALTDPDLRSAARRIADSFTTAGGAPAAADALESLQPDPANIG